MDEPHRDFHKKISTIFKKKFTLNNLKDIKIESFLDPYSRGGLVGIKNFGNSCFISAAIHLLANCLDLTKYFLSKSYVEEINKSAKKTSKGQIAKVYYDLVKEIWLSAQEVVSPTEIRQIVTNITNQVN